MKVLVTGASGLIGSAIAKELDKKGHEVIAQTRQPGLDIQGFKGSIFSGEFYNIDWGKVGKIDGLIHQAAIINAPSISHEEMMRINAYLPIELFRQALDQGVRHIVYASSTAVYGNTPIPFRENTGLAPVDSYGKSKLSLDFNAMDFARETNSNVIGLRLSNIYGPGEDAKSLRTRTSPVHRFAKSLLEKGFIEVPANNPKRDLLYIDDAVEAHILALQGNKTGTLNCGTGKPINNSKLAEILIREFKIPGPVYLGVPLPLTSQIDVSCDMSLTREKLGFEPKTDIVDGIRKYIASGELGRK